MAIFVIFRVASLPQIEAALKEVFPNDHLQVGPGQWLVSAIGTAKDVSDRLRISDGSRGAAMIFSMGNYFGRAPTDIWDWIKAKAEKPGG
jgi:hypothetical protein